MKVFYHKDPDGMAAAAVVYKYIKENNPSLKIECIGINYNMEFPLASIKKDELVYIVDFSISDPADFDKLMLITTNIIWIDHHKTSIEKYIDYEIPGLQVDGTSGCELTWQWCFPGKPVPYVIGLIGDYDLWKFIYGEDTKVFNVATRLYDIRPYADIWEKWLDSDYFPEEELRDGRIAINYRDNYYASVARSWAYLTEIEGHSAIACNAASVSSQLFDTLKIDCDVLITYVFDGKKYSVSLYAKNPDVDVSEIAKIYGGGGHKGASGFIIENLPFQMTGII